MCKVWKGDERNIAQARPKDKRIFPGQKKHVFVQGGNCHNAVFSKRKSGMAGIELDFRVYARIVRRIQL